MTLLGFLLSGAGVWGYLLYKLIHEGYWVAAVGIGIVFVIYYVYKENHCNNNEVDDEQTIIVDAGSYDEANVNNPVGCLAYGKTLSNGRYIIYNYLSHGGFGNTYHARDTLMNIDVAIKELFVSDICSRHSDDSIVQTMNVSLFDSFKKKFVKEAKRLQKFDSSHIVKVYECFEENDTAYYVMELIKGKSLKEIIEERKAPLTESELRSILPGLFEAIQDMHQNHLWHLDIKPANIMIRNDTKSVVLIDFGASKQIDCFGESLTTTNSQMLYSRGYAPLEQIEGSMKNIGSWTDIYALGATFYYLLTAQKPPEVSEISDTGIPQLGYDVSSQMEDAINKMMQPNRRMRPQSIMEVRQLLGML